MGNRSNELWHEFEILNDGTCGGYPVSFYGIQPLSARYTGASVRCYKCGSWYNSWQHMDTCPHISWESPVVKLKPELPLEEELKIRREGYVFARRVDDLGYECIEAVNSCPYGPAWPDSDNLKAHAWYAGWWFYWYIVKRWCDAAIGIQEE